MMKEISEEEHLDLKSHASVCEHCKAEYQSVMDMETIVRHLATSKPTISGKDELIKETLEKLDQKRKTQRGFEVFLMSKRVLTGISSLAAGLLLFFFVQQFYLYSSLQNLETRNGRKVESIYSKDMVKAKLLIKYTDVNKLRYRLNKLNRAGLSNYIYKRMNNKQQVYELYKLKESIYKP
jgi:hypothetical protein